MNVSFWTGIYYQENILQLFDLLMPFVREIML